MDKKQQLVDLIDISIYAISAGFFFIFPLFFLTNVSEFTSYPKLVLLLLTASILIILWVSKAILQQRFIIAKTPLDVVFVLLVVTLLLATWFSPGLYTSLFGTFNNWHWTAVELIAFISVYYVVVTNLAGRQAAKVLQHALTAAAFVASLLTIVIYFNVFDRFNSSEVIVQLLSADGFSPVGSTTSTLLLVLTGLFLIAPWLYKSVRTNDLFNLGLYGLMSTSLLVGLLLLLSPYIPGLPTRGLQVNQLDFSSSWRVASSTIRDNPWFGVGPSMYRSAYQLYRPKAMNATEDWNVAFTQSGSEYLSWLTTMGVVGLVALLMLVGQILRMVRRSVFERSKSLNLTPKNVVILAVFTIAFVFLFSSSTVLTSGLLFMLLSVWMLWEKAWSREALEREVLVEEVMLSFSAIRERFMGQEPAQTSGTSATQIMPFVLGVPLVVYSLFVGYFTIIDLRSNLAYARSVQAANTGQPVRQVYTAQSKAIQLNPRRELYRRAFASTNINLATAIANQRGEEISDTERQDVLGLVEIAIREARVATELINPASAANWQARGNVYLRLLGVVQGADDRALQAYNKAISLAPTDPRYLVSLGDLHYRLATNQPSEEGTEGEAPSKDIPETPNTRTANLARAEAAYLSAINLKPDYAQPHYQLAQVYKQVKRYKLAKQQLEATLRLLDSNAPSREPLQQELQAVEKQIEK